MSVKRLRRTRGTPIRTFKDDVSEPRGETLQDLTENFVVWYGPITRPARNRFIGKLRQLMNAYAARALELGRLPQGADVPKEYQVTE